MIKLTIIIAAILLSSFSLGYLTCWMVLKTREESNAKAKRARLSKKQK
mgnify:CR=1|tara:strand:+ start:2215 stop:2358 length:144 start_codon:yes stop_codon:yes gene_type:complete